MTGSIPAQLTKIFHLCVKTEKVARLWCGKKCYTYDYLFIDFFHHYFFLSLFLILFLFLVLLFSFPASYSYFTFYFYFSIQVFFFRSLHLFSFFSSSSSLPPLTYAGISIIATTIVTIAVVVATETSKFQQSHNKHTCRSQKYSKFSITTKQNPHTQKSKPTSVRHHGEPSTYLLFRGGKWWNKRKEKNKINNSAQSGTERKWTSSRRRGRVVQQEEEDWGNRLKGNEHLASHLQCVYKTFRAISQVTGKVYWHEVGQRRAYYSFREAFLTCEERKLKR